LAGPPCIDYSGVNARAQGVHGKSGQLLLRTGDLIQKIMQHRNQVGRHVFYLVENVVLYGDNLHQVTTSHFNDIAPWTIDSACFSPCKRNRMYFSNVPLQARFDKEETTLMTPSSCLEDGCVSAGNLDDTNARAKVRNEQCEGKMHAGQTNMRSPAACFLFLLVVMRLDVYLYGIQRSH
jgi:hypothetical protein